MEAWKVGDKVRTWYDTGAFGAAFLYGKVVQAGPKQVIVMWESGLTNRLRYSNLKGTKLCSSTEWFPDERFAQLEKEKR